MKWAMVSSHSQSIQHSEGQSVTPEYGTSAANVFHAGIKTALAKLKFDLPPNAMDQPIL